ncbi:MAG TPA: PspC domain-containing protein [Flavobacterium sp.]|jgi:phage shock protein PspC (stress-responsive transcriptional regulator)
MNKTVNINLGGMFFHIDEDAYQKLTRYFDAIKRSLTNPTGQDEIIKDIEMRIAELIAEKHINEKQVINLREVDEVILVMGQPEDYRIEPDGDEPPSGFASTTGRTSKKLYRDIDNSMIGGVLSGLGHYFGIDKVWLRIILLILVFFWGIGIFTYIILWIVMPAAITTSEKLEMTGEPVTISNIEKKVREEFENVSDKFRNANYDAMGNKIRTGSQRVTGSIGDVLLTIFRIFAKVLGAMIVVFSAVMLGSLLIGVFTLGSTSIIDVPWQNYADAVNYTNMPLGLIGLLVFIAIGVPFFFLFILGLKLLVKNLKSIGSIAKYTLLALWIIAVGILIALGVKQATEIAFDGKVVQKQTIAIAPTDTLYVKFRHNDYYSKNIDDTEEFLFTQDENSKEVIYSTNVHLHFMKTDEKFAHISIEKVAEGKSLSEAKKRAEKINYSFKIEGNQLILDNYLLTEIENKYRNQEVDVYLYLPQNQIIKTHNSIENYDVYDDDYTVPEGYDERVYKAQGSEFICLNCPVRIYDADGNEVETLADTTAMPTGTTITIDDHGVKVTEGTNKGTKGQTTKLEIKDGIIIKTE